MKIIILYKKIFLKMKVIIVGNGEAEHSELVSELAHTQNKDQSILVVEEKDEDYHVNMSTDGKKEMIKIINSGNSTSSNNRPKNNRSGNKRSKNLRFYSVVVNPGAASIQTIKRTVDNSEYRIGSNKYITDGATFSKLALEDKIAELFILFNDPGQADVDKKEILKALRVYAYITSLYSINNNEVIHFEYF